MGKSLGHIFLLMLLVIPCKGQVGRSLEADIQYIIDRYKAVGASVVAVKDNRIVYTRSFGYNPDYNDTTLRIAIPSNGVYVIASISKSFISTAIMQLAEKGKLKLNDDVNKYLDFRVRNPKYSDVPITVRMLMSHRSTINDKHYGWNLNQINPKRGKKWQECYNDYKPGTKFSYCNLNYNLLGAIIEKVSGERFFDYIDENIMSPLGLNASYNLTKIDSTRLVKALKYDSKEKIFKKDASIYNYQYYVKQLKNYKLGYSTACFSPSGGVKISALDLAKYMMMHMNYGEYDGKRIISKAGDIKLWTPISDDSEYALVFFRTKEIIPGEDVVGIRGGAHGVHSAMYFSPVKKFGFIVICNGCTAENKMKNGIAVKLYEHLILNR